MKMSIIKKVQDNIDGLEDLLFILREDFKNKIDDELWTVNIDGRPIFIDEYTIQFRCDVRLKKKFVQRLCEDYEIALDNVKDTGDFFEYTFSLDTL